MSSIQATHLGLLGVLSVQEAGEARGGGLHDERGVRHEEGVLHPGEQIREGTLSGARHQGRQRLPRNARGQLRQKGQLGVVRLPCTPSKSHASSRTFHYLSCVGGGVVRVLIGTRKEHDPPAPAPAAFATSTRTSPKSLATTTRQGHQQAHRDTNKITNQNRGSRAPQLSSTQPKQGNEAK